ncbi:hypothetical protein ACHAXT_004851 [Thalassiosira profunda]
MAKRPFPRTAAALSAAALCGCLALFGRPQHEISSSEVSSSVSHHLPPPSTSLDAPFPPNDVVPSPAHRRLSNALPDGGCEITWPAKPPPGIPITYAASYPGCGARMTWNLVEALTGLWTGDDWNNNGRGDEVVTVKTHYPQSNGVLVDFDERIQRGFVMIRNPMKSIPSFFNHIYEMRNHLPVHSERAPLEEWIKWRNAYVDIEIAEYKKFICYWMDRYAAKDRLLITYEGLTDDLIGAEVAKSLNTFLGQVEGVTPIATESVPCIWRAVVKNQPPPQQAAQIKKLQALAANQPQGDAALQAAAQQQQPPQPQAGRRLMETAAQQQPHAKQSAGSATIEQQPLNQQPSPGLRRRLDPGHHDSQRKGPEVPRPYTPEQLESMMTMLLEVGQRYQNEDVRLYHIMMGYYEQIRSERLKLSSEPVKAVPPGGYF